MILVTGATGFLGSELTRQLISKNEPIRAIKRTTSIIPETLKLQRNIHWVDADLLDYLSLREAFEGVKQVYHCAGLTSFRATDKKKMRSVNVEGTAHVVNLCLDKKVEKLVHVSSETTLEDSVPPQITPKSRLTLDKMFRGYAISKQEGEMEVFRAIAEGLDAVVINPSLMIGKRWKEYRGETFLELVKNRLKYNPAGRCGLVDVEDVAKSMIVLMNSSLSSQRYIINAENWSYRDLFLEIVNQLKMSPSTLLLKWWKLQSSLQPIFSLLSRDLRGANKPRIVDVSKSVSLAKIKKDVNIEFKPIKQVIAEISS